MNFIGIVETNFSFLYMHKYKIVDASDEKINYSDGTITVSVQLDSFGYQIDIFVSACETKCYVTLQDILDYLKIEDRRGVYQLPSISDSEIEKATAYLSAVFSDVMRSVKLDKVFIADNVEFCKNRTS